MLPRVECPHCGHDVEQATYCGHCGQPLASEAALEDPTSRLIADGATGTDGRWRGRWSRLADRMLPDLRPGPGRITRPRLVAAVGLALVLIPLLAGSPGLAIIVAACIVPAIVATTLRALDLFEREPWIAYLVVALGGFGGGLLIAVAKTLLVAELWLDQAVLNVGAAGYGGRLAEAEGLPPLTLIVLSGIALPLIAEAVKLAGPLVLRRWAKFRNEVMDGIALGATAAAGFSVAGVVVYVWPLLASDQVPDRGVADWTATLLGLLVVRPLILCATTALICAGVWQAALTRRQADARSGVVPGLAGALLFALGDLLLQPSGTRVELLWGVLILVALAVALGLALDRARTEDRRRLGGLGDRLLCPACGSVTPAGAFCATCGAPLPRRPETIATHAAAESVPAAPAGADHAAH